MLTNAKKFVIRKKKESFSPPPCPKFAITLGEQMEEALAEWYAALGKSVPEDEIQICRDTDAEAAAELATEKMAALTIAPAKPVYGTPEFWKDYWARKKAGLIPEKANKRGAPKK